MCIRDRRHADHDVRPPAHPCTLRPLDTGVRLCLVVGKAEQHQSTGARGRLQGQLVTAEAVDIAQLEGTHRARDIAVPPRHDRLRVQVVLHCLRKAEHAGQPLLRLGNLHVNIDVTALPNGVGVVEASKHDDGLRL